MEGIVEGAFDLVVVPAVTAGAEDHRVTNSHPVADRAVGDLLGQQEDRIPRYHGVNDRCGCGFGGNRREGGCGWDNFSGRRGSFFPTGSEQQGENHYSK